MSTAVVVVDVQNDFCEGGSLPVSGGAAVAAAISRHLAQAPADRIVVATQDAHVDPGAHFGHPPDFVDSWPEHCVVGTHGIDFHPALDVSLVSAVFRKGSYAAAYSGFEGVSEDGSDLAGWLRSRGVTEVEVVGIATDHCVRATALDAVTAGFTTSVRLDLTAAVAPTTLAAALEEMRGAGVRLVGALPGAGRG